MKKKTKSKTDLFGEIASATREDFVFVTARIPVGLNTRLNAACRAYGLKKQNVIASGISLIVPDLSAGQR